MSEQVLVALGGGGASVLAATLLHNQGFRVSVVFFDIHDPRSTAFLTDCHHSHFDQNFKNVEKFCEHLGLPLSRVSLGEEFEAEVVDSYIHNALGGVTPTPCFSCQKRVLLPALLKEADRLKIDKVSTGHFAQVLLEQKSGDVKVLKGVEGAYDQSFMFSDLSQEELKRVLLPLGGIGSQMLQKLLFQIELDEFNKKTLSPIRTEPCFFSGNQPNEFVKERIPQTLYKHGVVKTPEGLVIGDHLGAYGFRLGKPPVGATFSFKEYEKKKLIVTEIDTKNKFITVNEAEKIQINPVGFKNIKLNPVESVVQPLSVDIRFGMAHSWSKGNLFLFENGFGYAELFEPTKEAWNGRPVTFYKKNELLGSALISPVQLVEDEEESSS
ncbi:MAG: hypothetical protein CL678_05425 [Bdellovibrionaceae bacterium]|nr:hypothetical protein [Pseudobdellovibrionaceae bacterium]|tara:strand:- start:521 stop:1666 length:1146 start_codon:yes stop_codon:yes gene_type:complete